jgi:hypothetical protein
MSDFCCACGLYCDPYCKCDVEEFRRASTVWYCEKRGLTSPSEYVNNHTTIAGDCKQ